MAKHKTDRISLPVMECKDNCGACCGPALAKEWEYQRVLALANSKGLQPVRQGATCPWYQNGRCAVYEARPFICRLFGHSDRLVCKHGLNVNVTPETERRMASAYMADGPVSHVRHLHEILGDDWQEEITNGLLKDCDA